MVRAAHKQGARRPSTRVEGAVIECVSSYYEAALDPSGNRWQTALASTAALVGATGTVLFGINTRLQRATFGEAAGFSAEAMAEYQAHWALQDIRINEVLKHPAETVLNDNRLIPSRQLKQTAIYNDFLTKQDAVHVLATAPTRLPNYYTIMAVQGSRRRGSFEERDARILSRVVPHTARAMQLHDRLSVVHGKSQVFEAALGVRNLATIYIDEVGEIFEVSDAAMAIVRSQTRVAIVDRRLLATDPVVDGRLNKLVNSALRLVVVPTDPAGGSLLIKGAQPGEDIQILVIPIPRLDRFFSPLPAVAVFLSKPRSASSELAKHLEDRFQLSPAEVRLAVALRTAASLSAIAQSTNVSPHTVRAQLKNIFAKTDCHSQLELMRLLVELESPEGRTP
jgi:DNA-binding CsgD family transcriptional regulator